MDRTSQKGSVMTIRKIWCTLCAVFEAILSPGTALDHGVHFFREMISSVPRGTGSIPASHTLAGILIYESLWYSTQACAVSSAGGAETVWGTVSGGCRAFSERSYNLNRSCKDQVPHLSQKGTPHGQCGVSEFVSLLPGSCHGIHPVGRLPALLTFRNFMKGHPA